MPDHNVTTHRNDTSRSGAYLAETELTPATIASSQFGKLYERIVNGDVYAQPLYVRGVATASGTRNLFFIATSTNDVYAFDADDTSTDPWAARVWQRNLNPWRPLVIGNEICTETVGSVGITSTPVIDTGTNTMYVVTRRSGGTVIASGGQLYQLHNNGRIWRYTGTPITGWQLIGDNPLTVQIAASNSSPGLFQLDRTGAIWRYDGAPITGWTRIDANPQTVGLVAAGVSGGATLTQLRDSGAIWVWSGASAWTQLDNNPRTVQITSASTIGGTQLYQLHRTGAIWKYVGPGWQQLDNNPLTVKIVAAGPDLYQLHSNGNVWKYTGTPFTGWQQLDNNPATTDIVASPSGFGTPNYAKGSVLHQLHTTGKIWRYTGTPFSGWQMLDTNGATAQIVADNVTQDLYQVHIDGSIWRYTGTPCSGNNCPGWQVLDNNWALNDGANYLHAVNITDGTERRPPVVITATDAHGVRFDSRCQRQRPALLLLGGVVYLGFGTFSCDGGAPDGQPYRGWILGYRASDLAPAGVYCASPDGGGCGVWQSGGGLVGAPDGAIYFETGNDDVNHHAALGDSFVRLPVVAGGFGTATHFTPANADRLRDGGPLSPAAAAWYGSPTGPGDTDLGSGGPMLLPGGRLIGGGKQGRYYVLDSATMTQSQNATPGTDGFQGFQAFVNTYHPTFTAQDYEKGEVFGPNIHAGPIYWSGPSYLYQMPEKDYLKAFHYDTSTRRVATTPAVTATGSWARPPDGMPGGFTSLSANGASDGIIWTCLPQADGQWHKVTGALVAFDATTLRQIWSDDSPMSFAKFCPPTVADGKVIRPTFASDVHHRVPGKIAVYGLRPATLARTVTPPAWPVQWTDPSDPSRRTVAPQLTIEATFLAHGGPLGMLGTPVGPARRRDGGAWSRDYRSTIKPRATCAQPDNGAPTTLHSAIYFSPGTGAHVVSGAILAAWRDRGAENSALGLPVADPARSDGGAGQVSRFERGDIVRHPDTGIAVHLRR